MNMTTTAEYEANEAKRHFAQMRGYDNQPLKDRQEAREDFAKMLSESPEHVGRSVEWLLAGNYGFGAMQEARKIADGSPRLNKGAALCLMIGALDCGCPADFGRQAWKRLDMAQRVTLARHVSEAIANYHNGRKEEAAA